MSTIRKFRPFLLLIPLTGLPVLAGDFERAREDFNHHRYDRALETFEALYDKDNKDRRVLFCLAKTQLRMGDYAASGKTVEKLLSMEPDHVEAHYLAGVAAMLQLQEAGIFRKLGLAKSALASWQTVLELDPDHIQGHYAVYSYLMTAPAIAGGDPEKALTHLHRLEQLSPAWAELARGDLEAKRNHTEAAEQHYLNAVRNITDRASPWFTIARFYERNDQFDKALAAFREYRKAHKVWHDPGQAVTFYSIGRIHAELGNVEQARRFFNQVLVNWPNRRLRSLTMKALDDLRH